MIYLIIYLLIGAGFGPIFYKLDEHLFGTVNLTIVITACFVWPLFVILLIYHSMKIAGDK